MHLVAARRFAAHQRQAVRQERREEQPLPAVRHVHARHVRGLLLLRGFHADVRHARFGIDGQHQLEDLLAERLRIRQRNRERNPDRHNQARRDAHHAVKHMQDSPALLPLRLAVDFRHCPRKRRVRQLLFIRRQRLFILPKSTADEGVNLLIRHLLILFVHAASSSQNSFSRSLPRARWRYCRMLPGDKPVSAAISASVRFSSTFRRSTCCSFSGNSAIALRTAAIVSRISTFSSSAAGSG